METGRKTRITNRARIISNPEINTTVSGQKYAVVGNETIVHPTGRSTCSSAKEKQSEGVYARAELGMSGNRRFEKDCADYQRDEEENRRDCRRGEANQRTEN